MIVISFLEESLHGTCIYLFIIPTHITIVRSTTIYLHLIHYTLKLTLPLVEAIIFISTITFRGLSTLIISSFFFMLLLLMKLAN